MLDLNPFTGLAALINGLIESRKMGQWARLMISMGVSGLVTFLFTLGTGGLAHMASGASPGMAFALAFFEASIASAAMIFFAWRRSPLTGKIPISAPAGLEAAERAMLEKVIVTVKGKQ